MYQKYQTNGIVLSSSFLGEDSSKISIITDKFGLVTAKVQGLRNIGSKLKSGCQLFSSSHFSLIYTKSGWKVAGVSTKENFFENLKDDHSKLKILYNISKLILKIWDEEKNNNIFDIIENSFKSIEKIDKKMESIVECVTLVRILHSLGYMSYKPYFSPILSTYKLNQSHIDTINQRKFEVIELINQSLKATNISR